METLKRTRDIERAFREGVRASSALLTVIAVPTPTDAPREGRVMFIAGRRIGSAVVRNRSKRVLREACRRAGGPWPGFDVVLIAREGLASAPYAEVDAALARTLRRAGIEP